MQLRDAIRHALAYRSLSVPSLARSAGIGHNTIYRFLEGKTQTINPGTLKLMQQALNGRFLQSDRANPASWEFLPDATVSESHPTPYGTDIPRDLRAHINQALTDSTLPPGLRAFLTDTDELIYSRLTLDELDTLLSLRIPYARPNVHFYRQLLIFLRTTLAQDQFVEHQASGTG